MGVIATKQDSGHLQVSADKHTVDESRNIIIAEADLHMSIANSDGTCSCVCISDCTCNPCLLK